MASRTLLSPHVVSQSSRTICLPLLWILVIGLIIPRPGEPVAPVGSALRFLSCCPSYFQESRLKTTFGGRKFNAEGHFKTDDHECIYSSTHWHVQVYGTQVSGKRCQVSSNSPGRRHQSGCILLSNVHLKQ
ncbi:hypothetical protein B0H11DRAFT_133963 [Mycena galericulata]|nr:hypothetical protein B0H11DRAFT_133963 [Mycena galericulata]